MKKYHLIIIVVLVSTNLLAQDRLPIAKKVLEAKSNFNKQFEVIDSILIPNSDLTIADKSINILKDASYFHYNVNISSELLKESKSAIALQIPYEHENGSQLILDLVKTPDSYDDFLVTTSSGKQFSAYDIGGIHYRGVVRDNELSSIVALSIFENEIMGIINNGNTKFVLGKLNGNNTAHILYQEDHLKISSDFICETMPDESVTYSTEVLTFSETQEIMNTTCVEVYIEVDHDIFQDKGVNTINYLSGLFNQSATLYANDGITLTISEIFIWDTYHNYNGSCSTEILESFQNFRTTFNGDIGHLVSYDSFFGGIAAGFNALCNPNIAEKMCFSGIGSTHDIVPTYSWSVMVFAHEMGHLLGSRHTHACVWNFNNTAIDGCGFCLEEPNPPTNTSGCGASDLDCLFCERPPIPSEGGTIMSYCHQKPVGINFNNGFGEQPRNVILNNIANATCLSPCIGCTTDISHTGTINSGTYETSNTITSTAIVGTNQNVIYDAGNSILLKPNFNASSISGSKFHAKIDGCETEEISNKPATLNGSTKICENTEVFTLENGGSNVNWSVSSNLEIISSNDKEIKVNVKDKNTINNGFVKAILSNGKALSVNIDVSIPNGYQNFTIAYGPGALYEMESKQFWVKESLNGNWLWEWSMNNSAAKGAGSVVIIKPLTTGSLKVKARLKNECGLGNWLTKNFYVESFIDSNNPKGPNFPKNGFNDEANTSNILVYPNPVKNMMTIVNHSDETLIISLYNLTGKLMLSQAIAENSTDIDTSHLPNGVFFLKVNGDSTVVQKVIIQH